MSAWWAVFAFSALLQAENTPPVSSAIQAATSADEATGGIPVWQSIVRNSPKIGATAGAMSGFFEVYSNRSLSSLRPEDDRYFFSSDGATVAGLYMTVGNILGAAFIDGEDVLLSNKVEWVRRSGRSWQYRAVGEQVKRPLVPSDAGNSERSIACDIGSILLSEIGSDPLSARWSRSSGVLVASRGDGSVAVVRIRTPDDQLRFGAIIGEASLASPSGRWISHRCFIVAKESPLRPHLPNMTQLCDALKAVDRRGQNAEVMPLPEYSEQAGQAALRLHRFSWPPFCRDDRRVTDPVFSTAIHENLQYLSAVAAEHYEPALKARRAFKQRDQFAHELASELSYAAGRIEMSLVGDTGVLDDPAILWLGFEETVLPRNADTLYLLPVRLVLTGDTPLALKVKVASAMAEIGTPPWALDKDVPFDIPGHDGLFLKAIFHAKWGRPAAEEEIEICLAKVRDDFAGLEAKGAAVDCLLNWGSFDKVPEAEVDVWFRDRMTGTEATRRAVVKALTRQPEGRKYLNNKFDQLKDDQQSFTLISSIMRARAVAALQASRTDFMSNAECQETLRIWTAPQP